MTGSVLPVRGCPPLSDYKDHVIDLLMRVTRVSVETQAIVEAMKAGKAAR